MSVQLVRININSSVNAGPVQRVSTPESPSRYELPGILEDSTSSGSKNSGSATPGVKRDSEERAVQVKEETADLVAEYLPPSARVQATPSLSSDRVEVLNPQVTLTMPSIAVTMPSSSSSTALPPPQAHKVVEAVVRPPLLRKPAFTVKKTPISSDNINYKPHWLKAAESLENAGKERHPTSVAGKIAKGTIRTLGTIGGAGVRLVEGVADVAVAKPIGIATTTVGAGVCLVGGVATAVVAGWSSKGRTVAKGLLRLAKNSAKEAANGTISLGKTVTTGVPRYILTRSSEKYRNWERNKLREEGQKEIRRVMQGFSAARSFRQSLDDRMVKTVVQSKVAKAVKVLTGTDAHEREIRQAAQLTPREKAALAAQVAALPTS